MGLFDFLKKKEVGIENIKFNSRQFQLEICALALWKLEENNGKPDIAISELKKVGLNDEQVQVILKKVNQLGKEKDNSNLNGIDEKQFNSEKFQRELLDASHEFYFKNNHSYDAVKQDLTVKGLNDSQATEIISKLKAKINGMVDDFTQQLDSGKISEIKIKPNPEHVKGKVDSEQVDKYIAFGAYQMDRGDLENALELFDKAIELDENATLAYANKGSLYTKKDQKDKALEFYNKALKIEPNHVEILENKMDLLFKMMTDQNEKEFIETAATILKNDPQHPNALIYIIQFHVKENDLENALKSVKILFSNFHSESIAIQLLLDVFHKLPNERALNEFSILRNELNDNAKYQLEYCKGLYLMGIKEYEISISTFENLNNQHEFSWNYYQIAIIKNFQNKTDECLTFLKKTFELEPDLKEDAKEIPYFQNLATNPAFLDLIK